MTIPIIENGKNASQEILRKARVEFLLDERKKHNRYNKKGLTGKLIRIFSKGCPCHFCKYNRSIEQFELEIADGEKNVIRKEILR